jgi:hypothetical protein
VPNMAGVIIIIISSSSSIIIIIGTFVVKPAL